MSTIGEEVQFNAIDLFSGCGGLTEGLKQAGFNVIAGIEVDDLAAKTYLLNHPNTKVFTTDIRQLDITEIDSLLIKKPLHLLTGCPPCQGFSIVRRLNKTEPVDDPRNDLILEFYRFVKHLKPYTIMMENVPGLIEFPLFLHVVSLLKNELKYSIDFKVVDISGYGVPQRRKRLVMLGSRIGKIMITPGTNNLKTVRDAIGNIKEIIKPDDPLHQIYPKHTAKVDELISLIPKDGGSRKSLPESLHLKCHKKNNIGFSDVYGRMAWEKVSTTITGGCLNPSKGRFLHPEENRCISAREAALLQTFPPDYNFPLNIPKSKLALQIGNALPPEFSRQQAVTIFEHLKRNLPL